MPETSTTPVQQRIKHFSKLGEFLHEALQQNQLDGICEAAYEHNRWFIPRFTKTAFRTVAHQLTPDNLQQWADYYSLDTPVSPRTIGVSIPGNTPLTGFHDILAVLIAGHRAIVKQPEHDKKLLPYLARFLQQQDSDYADQLQFRKRLTDTDAHILYNFNRSRYYGQYFEKETSLIRKKQRGVGILTGEETTQDLEELGKDIFLYFGQDLRSIGKLFVPKGYDFEPLLETLSPYEYVMEYDKYKNNYDYNRSIRIVNQIPHEHTDFVMFQEKEPVISPGACVYYQTYTDQKDLQQKISDQQDKIQCIITSDEKLSEQFDELPVRPPGKAHFPTLWDYPNRKDTMQFLLQQ